jgi:hypothetical protein
MDDDFAYHLQAITQHTGKTLSQILLFLQSEGLLAHDITRDTLSTWLKEHLGLSHAQAIAFITWMRNQQVP